MSEQGVITSTSVPNKQPQPIKGKKGTKMPAGKGRYTVGGKGTHGCKGFPVVGGEGKVHGCHPTRAAAIQQQAAIYASQAQQAAKFLKGEVDSLDFEPETITFDSGCCPDVQKSMDGMSSEDCPCAGQEGCECDDMETDDDMTNKAAPCWDGYVQRGMKPGENGQMVPNCVPVSKSLDDVFASNLPKFAKRNNSTGNGEAPFVFKK